MSKKFPESYDFCPTSYVMPQDQQSFLDEKARNPKVIWISKPINSSCGKGVKLFCNIATMRMNVPRIISRYIMNPHLINRLKYDLRLYACVTCFCPLRIHLYNEGLVRFATLPFSTKKKHIKKKFCHLTNYSVNKDSPFFIQNQDAEDDGNGSKWSLRGLKLYWEQMGINSASIFENIKDVIIKSLIAVEPHIVKRLSLSGARRTSCYELYGFDILVDENFKPWLLEINIFPSLAETSPLDQKLKSMLVVDTFNLIGIVLRGYSNGPALDYRFNKTSAIQAIEKCSDLDEVSLTTEDALVIIEGEEELFRRGGYERIFPLEKNIDRYCTFFEVQRFYNVVYWKYLKSKRKNLKKLFRRLKNPSNV